VGADRRKNMPRKRPSSSRASVEVDRNTLRRLATLFEQSLRGINAVAVAK
jgi:hypothetical protein